NGAANSFNATAPVSPARSDVIVIVIPLVTVIALTASQTPPGLVKDVNGCPAPTGNTTPPPVSLSKIVTVAGFGEPIVAPPVAFESVALNVSALSATASLHTATLKVLL